MVADRQMVLDKLNQLEMYVEELESLQKYSIDDLQRHLANLWTVTHGLQLSIQIILDVGNHLLSDLGIKVGDYTEIIDKMGETGIIPGPFAQKIRGMAGFRNVLVHGYITLNINQVYQVLQNNLTDFIDFNNYVNKYLNG
ncbi:MAG: DUF86 domain-containing protein [Firmicutes bacterium]|nr:DUF86 domain-containing protein [Bacillota bacterium]